MKNVLQTILIAIVVLPISANGKVALKTNLLYDASASPNLGVEFKVSPQWTVDVSGNYNPFEFSHNRMWKHWLVQPEARRWTSEAFRGGFFAGHLFGGEFNYSFGHTRREGWAAGVGVGYGYTWRFGRNWGLEAEIAVGYSRYGYDKYPCTQCGKVIASRTKNYVGPTKAALSIAYYFGAKKPQPAPVVALPSPTEAAAAACDTVVYPNFNFIFVEAPTTGIRRMDFTGSANLKFRTSKTNIDPTYLDNSTEICKITVIIDSIRSMDNVEITGMWIKGYASPEGRYAVNERLAHDRTEAMKIYLLGSYNFSARIIETAYEPENWQGLREALAEWDIPTREDIITIIDSQLEPDVKEARIKARYPAEYARIKDEIYPSLRRTDYRVDYAHFYKTEEISALHDVNLTIADGDYVKAQSLLDRLPSSPEATYAQGILCALQGEYEQAISYLRKAQAEGVAPAENAIRQVQKFLPFN